MTSVVAFFLTVVLLIAEAFTFLWSGVHDMACDPLSSVCYRPLTGLGTGPFDCCPPQRSSFTATQRFKVHGDRLHPFSCHVSFLSRSTRLSPIRVCAGALSTTIEPDPGNVHGRSDDRLYWSVKNGIKMT